MTKLSANPQYLGTVVKFNTFTIIGEGTVFDVSLVSYFWVFTNI